MKIGVDCRPIQGNFTGVGRYLNNILKCWQGSPRGHEYYLYFNNQNHPRFPSDNFHHRVLSMRSVFFDNISVPISVIRDDVDIYWSQFKLPVVLPPHITKVVSIHDLAWHHYTDEWSLRYKLAPLLLRLSAKHSDVICTVSQFSKEEIIETYGVKDEDIIVTPNSVSKSPEVSRTRKEFRKEFDLNSKFILSVGTMYRRRYPETIINAFRELHTKHPNLSLLIVGKVRHPSYDSFEELCSECGVLDILGDDIQHRAFISESDLNEAYKFATAFVYLSEYEGFGIPPLEAMTFGTPVVTANCRPLSDIYGDNAITINPKDGESLMNSLESLLKNEDVYNKYSYLGKELAEQSNWQESSEKIIKKMEESTN